MRDQVLAPSGVPLKQELGKRLERAHSERLVHIGGLVDVSNISVTRDHLQVVNNILKIRETRPKPTFSA